MSRNAIIGLVAVLVLIFIGWNILSSRKSTTTTPPSQTTTPASKPSGQPSATEGGSMVEESNSKTEVKITSSGFMPQSITIKKGKSVTWINDDTKDHTINSAPHPTHTTYPRLNIGAIKAGTKASLSFPDAGSYKYHDHLNPSLTGSITVE